MTHNTKPPVRIGMLSFAHMHAHSYASSVNELPDAQLIGIYDDNPQRANAAAKQHNTRVYNNLNALLNDIDAIIICSENSNHRPHVEQAAPHVRYILCEKPIATTRQDAHAMLRSCETHNSKLQIAFPVRYAPPVQRAKTLLSNNTLGTIISVNSTNNGRMPDGWFTQKHLSGGGAIIDHTVHVIDLLRWFWQTEITEIHAEISHSLLHPDTPIDDAGILSFQLKNGTYGTLDTSWSRPTNYPTWGNVKLEFLGEHGTLKIDAFNQNLRFSGNSIPHTQLLHWGSNADTALIKDFVRMAQDDTEPSITGHDGLKALEVALAAYESAEKNAPVKLNQ